MIIDNASLINEVDYSSINWGPLDCYDAPYKTDKSLALYQRVVRCLTWLLYFEGKKQKREATMGVVLQSLMAIIVVLTSFAADSYIEEGTATSIRDLTFVSVYIYKYLYIVL